MEGRKGQFSSVQLQFQLHFSLWAPVRGWFTPMLERARQQGGASVGKAGWVAATEGTRQGGMLTPVQSSKLNANEIRDSSVLQG
jgi:hypothetical protein